MAYSINPNLPKVRRAAVHLVKCEKWSMRKVALRFGVEPSTVSRWITKPVYDEKLKELKEKQHDLDQKLQEHTYADENYYITVSSVFSLAKRAKELFNSSDVLEKRALLNYLLQNCTADGKNLVFTLRSPFNHILAFTKRPVGLRV